jgi:PadR family transcriptional regulator AphA
MARVQRTPFVILGLLALSDREPRSGYEIKKVIDNVISHFWAESNGQLYPVLKRLCAEQCIRQEAKSATGRKKILYAITPKGKARLRSWLAEPPEPAKPRDELILKLFFGSQADLPTLLRHLGEYRAKAQATLERCREWQQQSAAQPEDYRAFHLITLRAGIAWSETTVRWADESLAALRRLPTARHGAGR